MRQPGKLAERVICNENLGRKAPGTFKTSSAARDLPRRQLWGSGWRREF